MNRRTPLFLILLSAIFCLPAPAQEKTPPASPPSAAKKESDFVVLRVSGMPVTESQVVEMIREITKDQHLPATRKQEDNELLFKDAIENLTTITILKNQAGTQNITIDKAVIDREIQEISKKFASPEDFQKALARQNTTEAEYRKNIEDNMRMQKLLDRAVTDAPPPTEEELRKYYDENPEKFRMPERVRASQILLRTDAKNTMEQNAGIKKQLEGIRADIENRKITFAEAARKYSEDPATAREGGDLHFFTRGQMSKPFEDVAFAMNPGTVSPVIRTSAGFHIIQVTEIRPAGKELFEDAKSAIQAFLDKVDRQKAVQKYVDGLKQKATIETFMTPEEFVKRHPSK
jgi:parvulin-like peptidyl-prolyl isomerase